MRQQMPYVNLGVPNELAAQGVHLQKWLEANWTLVMVKPDTSTKGPWLSRVQWCKEHAGEDTYDWHNIGTARWYFRDTNTAILFKLSCA